MKKLILCLFIFLGQAAFATDQNAINLYVQKAPEIKDHSKLSALIKYLTREYKEEEDLARAILAWIVYNIDYDDYLYRQLDKNNKTSRDLSYKIPQRGDIIKTRLGVCQDIAILYSEILEKINIKSHVIYGCVAPEKRTKTCKENPHAWNAIWINKQWELVDPTWAMGATSALQSVSNKTQYNREVRKRGRRIGNDNYAPRTDRTVDLSWFKVDPQQMAETHQPEEKRWYLKNPLHRKRKN